MSCRRATELISNGMDRQLSGKERLWLRLHTFICSSCRRFRGHLALVRSILGILPEGGVDGPSMPEDVRDRIRLRIDQRIGE